MANIEIRIARLEQLFNSFDPSPFDERDLDEDAESHIVNWARELPSHEPISLLLHLPKEEAVRAKERGLETVLKRYFEIRGDWIERDRRELFRLGRIYLVVGFVVLSACLLLRQILPHLLGEGPTTRIFQEGLVILGWVANWKPLETFLYDWWPLKRRAQLYSRIAAANVEYVPND